MTNPTKLIQVSKTNCVVLCLVDYIHVSVLILCLNVQTLVDQFGCSVKARVGKVKKGVNVCFFLACLLNPGTGTVLLHIENS